MTVLQVEVEDFVAASCRLYDDVAEPVRVALGGLESDLAGSGGMAGDDQGGVAWAREYDEAARSVLGATGDLVNATYGVCALLGRSAQNYAEAEDASTADGSADLWAQLQRLPPDCTLGPPRVPPSAAGGGGDAPTGWGLVRSAVGHVWPNGHQDRLRRAADAWRRSGGELSGASCQVMGAARGFDTDRLPEAADVTRVLRGTQERLSRLGEAHYSLAGACDELAEHLDHCHDEVRSELAWMLGESAALQTVGLLASFVTLGTAEAPTQVAQAGRIALAARRIAALIEKFLAAAARVREAVAAARRAARAIADELEVFLNPRLATAGVTQAGGLAKAGTVARGAKDLRMTRDAAEEAGAARRLERAGTWDDVIDESARRHILDGDGHGNGGHRWRPGASKKSLFPKDWSDEKILQNVADIVTDPRTEWRAQTGSGGMRLKNGAPAVWRAWEVRDGVRIRVAYEPATGRVITAFPDVSGAAKGMLVP